MCGSDRRRAWRCAKGKLRAYTKDRRFGTRRIDVVEGFNSCRRKSSLIVHEALADIKWSTGTMLQNRISRWISISANTAFANTGGRAPSSAIRDGRCS